MENKFKGFYDSFGGQFVSETLIPAIDELEKNFNYFKSDKKFLTELNELFANYAGRPTPIYYAKNLSRKYDTNIYLKREDLLHTGAHKINNTIGQGLLAKYMGKKRIIAETGAGQHGVATATIAALLGLKCVVYMGEKDTKRQALNVQKMKLLGAEVISVKSGSKTLKDAINEALKDWVKNVVDSYYLIGSVLGPHPFPEIVAHFQSVIGKEVRDSIKNNSFITPDVIVACVGGGSNAIGIFKEFIKDKEIDLIGVEAGGISDEQGKHARTIGLGSLGILHGCLTYVLQDENHQISKVHSISAGLDYPAVGPQHAELHKNKRAHYASIQDKDAIFAFQELTRLEGIIPALESSHAVAYILKNYTQFKGKNVLINLSGRGDKDLISYEDLKQKESL